MADAVKLEIVDRRDFVLSAACAAAVASFLSGFSPTRANTRPPTYEEALAKVLGNAKPEDSKTLLLELPEIAENGNTVPFTVSLEAAMAGKDMVKAIHLIASGNPLPAVATFRFTPLSGKAAVSSRMRLAKSQDVVVVAEMADGRFLMAKRAVKVTIGGCGG